MAAEVTRRRGTEKLMDNLATFLASWGDGDADEGS